MCYNISTTRTLDVKSVAKQLNNITILTSPMLAKVCCASGILQLTRRRGVSYCFKGYQEMITVYIYGLYDPRTFELRYIGKTVNLKTRLGKHIQEAKGYHGHNLYKERWIRQLLSDNLKPILITIGKCTNDNWQEVEREYINTARERGINLTNLADGGVGASAGENNPRFGKPLSQEAKDRISQANKGKLKGEKHPLYGGGDKFTPEHRKNMSISAKNKPPITDETRRRRSQSHMGKTSPNKGKKLSEEWKRRVGEAFKGKPKTDNHNKKNSLTVTMMWSKRKGDIERIYQLQNLYLELFGEYNRKYPTP